MVVNTSLFFNASGLIKHQVVFINETLDFFEDIFDEPILNWVMISLYFIGIPAVACYLDGTDGPSRALPDLAKSTHRLWLRNGRFF